MFEWAGRPHQIVSGQTRVSDGLLIHIKFQRVTFFYRGVGRVVYGYNGKKDTDDSKLRRFAILPIEKTDEVPAAPYVPGTIALAAQRAKYPSLYPESTFQSGRL